ncbi:MAG: DUF2335 domain-containing protein [Rickettsiaceae bacterium]|nr:DUF2335 domain-containing protein [Rickettsiaceae bacterium]
MKEYFNQQNKLNKGYSEFEYKELFNALPKPEILAQYEELHPGSVENFIRLIEKEQFNRHKFLGRRERWQIVFKILGYLSFTLSFVVISVASFLMLAINSKISMIFSISAFSAMTLMAFIFNKQNK